MRRERFVRVAAVFAAAALVICMARVARAQAAQTPGAAAGDLTGSWQGMLEAGPSAGDKAQRIVLKVTRAGDVSGTTAKSGAWHGVAYNLDGQMPYEGQNTTQMSLEGGVIRFAIAPADLTYEGRLSADGASMVGAVTEGSAQAHPLTLARADGDAAWAIPKPDKTMAKDADPDWEVVTVKPNDPDTRNASLGMDGREFVVKRHTADTLLIFGYAVQKRQIVNAPDWLATDRWDVKGVPDMPGQPSLKQMQSLTRKLLVERFGLVTHTEKREMEVFALTVAKGGEKMTPSAGDPNGTPNENDNDNGGQRTMQMENASMGDLALLLNFMLDRPVVDQTGLKGRYDFRLRWTFDETRAPVDGSAAPSVFTAIQEQLGLKLEPVKAMTDVLAIDKVERPGAN
jgi:uncharacterized protein (TIGR03435 family)